jgi:hypothetical protein
VNHTLIALVVQGALWLVTGSLWAGCIAATAGFLMREVAQAEYRWIGLNGGLRSAMPWWMGLDMSLWSKHSLKGFFAPAAVTAAVAFFLH